ncbi:MAG TPA: arginine deiminase family protein [Steroidobacteraceae bacterium]|jgi:arginine deiminase
MKQSAGLNRRDAIRLLGAGAALLRWRGAVSAVGTAGLPFVTSDVARLRRVIMCPPDPDMFAPASTADDVLPMPVSVGQAEVEEHAELMRVIRAGGAEILTIPDLLSSAIDAARARGAWETWLRATHPKLAADPKTVTAQTLLGRDPATQYRTWPDGSYRHIVDGINSFIFSRDTAATLPAGVVLLNVGSSQRVREQVLLRFIFDWAPQLARYPVLFDARQEGLLAEGGDFQVADERTLFLGVGNRTDPRIAPILARRLQMDVLTVQTRKVEFLRPMGKRLGLRSAFLHLDSYFTHVADKQALTVPWFLEAAQLGKDPYTEYLKGMAADGAMSDDDLKAAREFMKDLGTVRLFRAGSAEEDTSVSEMKLVDFVRSRGYTVHFVGGEPPAKDPIRHLFKTVLPEHEHQGANVVATSPGRVVAYDGAEQTHAGLRRAGIQVTTFSGRELWPRDGGPHCLTMPLERG